MKANMKPYWYETEREKNVSVVLVMASVVEITHCQCWTNEILVLSIGGTTMTWKTNGFIEKPVL
jgi:hypothetical protein